MEHMTMNIGQPWQQVAHPAATLTALPKLPVARLTVTEFRGEEGQLAVGIERLPGAAFEFGLVVPRIHMAAKNAAATARGRAVAAQAASVLPRPFRPAKPARALATRLLLLGERSGPWALGASREKTFEAFA